MQGDEFNGSSSEFKGMSSRGARVNARGCGSSSEFKGMSSWGARVDSRGRVQGELEWIQGDEFK
eukprot:9089595-Pyramimonas_sp.AAC.1